MLVGHKSTDLPSVCQTHKPNQEVSSLPCSLSMDLTGAAATSPTNRQTDKMR